MLFYPDSFKVSTPGDREILVERDFDAPLELVFEAFTRPELVRRWLLGPDGWTMPVCEIDLRVGGSYRYVWRKESTGHEMGMGGVFLEVAPPLKIVATERFDDAWYPGEAIDTTVFEEREGGITRVRLTVLYESRQARDTATRSGMEHGMAAGYNRLEQVLSETGGLRHIEEPAITRTSPQLAAVIHLTIPRSRMRTEMGPALGEVFAAVQSQDAGPTGAWFDHHLRIHPEVFDFEVCVPVRVPVAATGRVVTREIPAERVARTIYTGPYEGLADAWKEFDAWIRAQGYAARPDLYQRYIAGPESGPDPAGWKTELLRPLAD